MTRVADQQKCLAFSKMQGAGNDFLLVNGAVFGPLTDPSGLARELCARRTSVGADGLILVEPVQACGADVRVRFWNPDGQEAATCGNGTRCAASFALAEGLAADEMVIDTKSGHIAARVSGDNVRLRYSADPTINLDATVSGPDGPRHGHRVEIGNFHFVIPVDTLPEEAIEPECRPLRYAAEFGEEGANIHLVEVLDRHSIRIRTYERGVEAETLACGSGSMSSAIALCAAGRVDSPVAVETRSGDMLTIRFERRDDGGFTLLELEGPARLVYTGELER
jgi:diaminopimelate epimerase